MAFAGKRRRVLIVVENLPVPFDRRVWQESRTLRDAGYEVTVICPATAEYPERFAEIEGIRIHRHPLPTEAEGALGYLVEYGTALFWEMALALRVAVTRGFDVIHACNPPDLIFLVAAPFRLFGKKFVFDHHDINPELFEAKFGRRGLFWRLVVLAERLTFKLADMSIATNESYRQIAIERGGMDPARVHVVRSGPDLARMQLRPPVSALRKGRAHLVCYVGVMGQQEGIDLLLEAVRVIVEDRGRRDIHFGLVGGGTSLAAMRELCSRMGLDDYVTFTGRASDSDLLDMLNTADVCVNPDTANAMNDKSTMNKIMEYMALGKPIVQFDLTEGRVSAQDASLYAKRNDPVDFADKIVELIDDPARRETMGTFGRQRVENDLQWRHEAPRLLAAYDTLWPDRPPHA